MHSKLKKNTYHKLKQTLAQSFSHLYIATHTHIYACDRLLQRTPTSCAVVSIYCALAKLLYFSSLSRAENSLWVLGEKLTSTRGGSEDLARQPRGGRERPACVGGPPPLQYWLFLPTLLTLTEESEKPTNQSHTHTHTHTHTHIHTPGH